MEKVFDLQKFAVLHAKGKLFNFMVDAFSRGVQKITVSKVFWAPTENQP